MKTFCIFAAMFVFGCKDKSGGGSTFSEPQSTSAPSTKPKQSSIIEATISKLGQPIVVDDVRISITRIVAGPAELNGRNGSLMTTDSRLIIWIQIENVSKDRKIDYSSFGDKASQPFTERGDGTDLFDQIGNRYAVKDNFNRHVGASGSCAIYPGRTITDVVMFEPPVAAAKEFTLILPTAWAIGTKRPLSIAFAAGLIERK